MSVSDLDTIILLMSHAFNLFDLINYIYSNVYEYIKSIVCFVYIQYKIYNVTLKCCLYLQQHIIATC